MFIPEKLLPGCASAEDCKIRWTALVSVYLTKSFHPGWKIEIQLLYFSQVMRMTFIEAGICSTAKRPSSSFLFRSSAKARSRSSDSVLGLTMGPWLCFVIVLSLFIRHHHLYILPLLCNTYTNHIQQDLIRVRLG